MWKSPNPIKKLASLLLSLSLVSSTSQWNQNLFEVASFFYPFQTKISLGFLISLWFIIVKSHEIVDKLKISNVTSKRFWLYCVSYFFWVYSIIQRVYPKSPKVGRPYMAFLCLVHFLSWTLRVTKSKKHKLLTLNQNLSLTINPFAMNEIYVE